MKITKTKTTVRTTVSNPKLPAPVRPMRLVKRVRKVVLRDAVVEGGKLKLRRQVIVKTARPGVVVTKRSVTTTPVRSRRIIDIPASSVRVRPGRPD